MNKSEQTNDALLPTEDEIEEEAQSRFTGILGVYKVARAEDKKLWCISIVFILTVYIHLMLKDLKDIFIIARQVPASISVLKLFWTPPVSTLFSLIAQRMLVRMSSDKVFKVLLCAYILYFLLYGTLILPFRDRGIEIDKMYVIDWLSDGKMEYTGFVSFMATIMTFTSWTSTLHFIAAEVWGSLIYGVFIFQMNSEACTERQLKRFIPIIYPLSTLGHLLCAATLFGVHYVFHRLAYVYQSVFLIGIFLTLCAITAGLLFMHRYLINTVCPVKICRNVKEKKKGVTKETIGFVEGLRMIFSTNIITALCTIVLGCNVILLMLDSSYKSCQNELSAELGKSKEGSIFFNKSMEEGLIMFFVIMFFVFPTRNIISWFGWTKVALITPVFASVVACSIFGLALLSTGARKQNIPLINSLCSGGVLSNRDNSRRLLLMEQYCGLIGISLIKVCRHIAFDVSKEFFGIRIDIAYRSRFRTVYDGIFSRLGKACGSVLQLVFNQLFNTLDIRQSSLPYLVIALLVCFIWGVSAVYLGGKYKKSMERNEWIDMEFKTK